MAAYQPEKNLVYSTLLLRFLLLMPSAIKLMN